MPTLVMVLILSPVSNWRMVQEKAYFNTQALEFASLRSSKLEVLEMQGFGCTAYCHPGWIFYVRQISLETKALHLHEQPKGTYLSVATVFNRFITFSSKLWSGTSTGHSEQRYRISKICT